MISVRTKIACIKPQKKSGHKTASINQLSIIKTLHYGKENSYRSN